jgi:hypothetical protein
VGSFPTIPSIDAQDFPVELPLPKFAILPESRPLPPDQPARGDEAERFA